MPVKKIELEWYEDKLNRIRELLCFHEDILAHMQENYHRFIDYFPEIEADDELQYIYDRFHHSYEILSAVLYLWCMSQASYFLTEDGEPVDHKKRNSEIKKEEE